MKNHEKNYMLGFLVTLAVLLAAVVIFIQSRPGPGRYRMYTHPEVKSLAIGTSYIGQGVVPSILSETDLPFEGRLFNFGINNDTSRYGPAYFHAIKVLVDPKATSGLFLVQVNPRGFKVSRNQTEPGADDFQEDAEVLSKIEDIRNFGLIYYDLNFLDVPLWKGLWDGLFPSHTSEVQSDGNVVINIQRTPRELERLIQRKYASYAKELAKEKFSEQRWDWFLRTVQFLDAHGTVVFVRLPSTNGHAEIEDRYLPDFDNRVSSLAKSMGTVFLNYKGQHLDYRTTEGAHLDRASAVLFTRELANDIRRNIDSHDIVIQ